MAKARLALNRRMARDHTPDHQSIGHGGSSPSNHVPVGGLPQRYRPARVGPSSQLSPLTDSGSFCTGRLRYRYRTGARGPAM